MEIAHKLFVSAVFTLALYTTLGSIIHVTNSLINSLSYQGDHVTVAAVSWGILFYVYFA